MILEQQILRKLTDGGFHSGQALAGELGISRASVWNSIQKLQSYGLDIYSVRGKGYRIPRPIEILDVDLIRHYVRQNIHRDRYNHAAQNTSADQDNPAPTALIMPALDVHWSLPSTNEYLLQPGQVAPVVCVSELQLNGRGRRGRQWLSPPGGNIYFSYKWRFNLPPAELSGLSLAVSVGVLRVLRGHCGNTAGAQNIGVKWPNDIVQQGRKLAGILLEMQGESDGPCTVVAGIGINIRIPPRVGQDIDQPWTDLESITGKTCRRSLLVADLVCELSRLFQLYESRRLEPFMAEWRQHDQLNNRPVTVNLPHDQYNGIARGIDRNGNLIVDAQGMQRHFASGEVSLRAREEDTSLV